MKKILKIVMALCLTINLNGEDLLLVDTSGSLEGYSTENKIKQVVRSYLDTSNTVLAFNDDVYMVKSQDDLDFRGGTKLSDALIKVASMDVEYLILLTDGEPNSKTDTLLAFKKLQTNNVKVCSVYISNDSKNVPEVLKQISDQIFVTSQIDQVFELCNSSVRDELIGKTAVIKQVDVNKYVF